MIVTKKINEAWNNLIYSHFSLFFWTFGFLAFLWFIIRSGSNPKRLTYPCQKLVYPLAASWVAAILSLAFISKLKGALKIVAMTLLFVLVSGLVLSQFISLPLKFSLPGKSPLLSAVPILWTSSNAVSSIFVYDRIPLSQGSLNAANASVPESYLSDTGIDSLFIIMQSQGKYLYKTAAQPTGYIAKDEVIIIKGNFQWAGTLSTNTDRIKGLIWKILNHPEGFTGEIMVCDNHQGVGNINNANNSDDTNQTIADVVNTFVAKGYPVSLVMWHEIMNNVVNEYTSGDMNNGYVYIPATKVSYPKFQSRKGNYISAKYGIWNTATGSFNKEKLFIINFPVLKAHGWMGATDAIKNWFGVITAAHSNERYGGSDNLHCTYIFGQFALPARAMADVCPDLNIMDATWVAPNDNYTNSSGNRIRLNTILASEDPVALSWYSVKHILNPVASDKRRTNPDYKGANGTCTGFSLNYATTFGYWTNYLINTAGFKFTRDSSRISIFGRKSVTSPSILVKTITISSNGGINVISAANGTLQLSAGILPANASNKAVTWSIVAQSGRASINSNGLVTAIANGTVQAIARANDGSGVSGTFNINITNQPVKVTSVAVSGAGGKSIIDIGAGQLQLFANVSPDNASDTTITWSIQNITGQGTISQSGLVRAVSNGTVRATATANDNSGITGTFTIIISNQSVSVNAISISGQGGRNVIDTPNGQLQMFANVSPDNANDTTITWSVQNISGQATISNRGLITAVSAGTIRVIAIANDGSGIQGSSVITINSGTAILVSNIVVTGNGGTSISKNKGTLQMIATITPANASNKAVTWRVVNQSGTASIDNNGLLTAISNGTVLVLARSTDDSNIERYNWVSIMNQLGVAYQINVNTANNTNTIALGSSLQLTASFTPASNNPGIIWSVQNITGQATISTGGLLTATGAGTVRVTATANDGSGISGSMEITITNITNVRVFGIVLAGSGGLSTVNMGSTLQVLATITPSNASNKTLQWTLENQTGTATINNGLITPVSVGQVLVKAAATDGSGVEGSLLVTITNQSVLVSRITVTGAGGTLISKNRGTLQMIATIAPVNASNKAVTWSVVNQSGTASIDNNGLLTGISNGTVLILATSTDGTNIVGYNWVSLMNQTGQAIQSGSYSENNVNTLTTGNISVRDSSAVFRLYPNPANGRIMLKRNPDVTVSSISIIDNTGKTIRVITDVNDGTIDLSGYKQGIYFIKMVIDNKIYLERIFIN